jgi:hypothetical protein
MTLRRAEIRLIRNSGLYGKRPYLIGGEVFSFNGGLAAIAGLLLYVPLRTARWSNRPRPRPCDVPIRVFDKFLVSPLRAMASSPDLSGNELSRDRSSRNDHRPQVPAARLSVCRNSSVCLFDRVVMSDHLPIPIPILFSTKLAHTPYGMGCTVNLIRS